MAPLHSDLWQIWQISSLSPQNGWTFEEGEIYMIDSVIYIYNVLYIDLYIYIYMCVCLYVYRNYMRAHTQRDI